MKVRNTNPTLILFIGPLFGRAVNFFIKNENISIKTLTIFKNNIADLAQEFNEWTLAKVAYDSYWKEYFKKWVKSIQH